jgi:hypothetical protein
MKYKQFTWPKWTKLDPWENREFIFQIWEKRYENYPDKKRGLELVESLKSHIKEAIARGDLIMTLTQTTLKGKQADILRVVENAASDPCNPQEKWVTPWGREHYIVSLESQKVDFEGTRFSILPGVDGDANKNSADLFFYKGIPYIAYWIGDYPGRNGKLYFLGDDRNYCVYEFTTKGRLRND